MTKQQLKTKYSEWNINNAYKCHERNNNIFHTMQNLASEHDLPIYCSMNSLLKELINTSSCEYAFSLYEEYKENEGKIEAVSELAISTDNFKI